MMGKGKKMALSEILRSKQIGNVELFTSVFYVLILMCVLMAGMQLAVFKETSSYVEDALAASNLASAVIDIQEYGKTHSLTIRNPQQAYQFYQDALQINLSLNDAWESPRQTIAGQVKMETYIVYNVTGTNVDIYTFQPGGSYHSTVSNGLGSVKSPNGQTIASTSVYSKISFPIDGILGVHVDAVKEKLVDVVVNN